MGLKLVGFELVVTTASVFKSELVPGECGKHKRLCALNVQREVVNNSRRVEVAQEAPKGDRLHRSRGCCLCTLLVVEVEQEGLVVPCANNRADELTRARA